MSGNSELSPPLGSPTQDLVSVIMNCLNGERYLREAIDSVYRQTYRNWEIIFWDNASMDRSAEIARGYDERLRYFRGDETVPLGAARNKAISQAKGDFIAFLDCDDIWLPHKLKHQIDEMNDVGFAACYGGIIKIDDRGNQIGSYISSYQSGHIFEELLRENDAHLPTLVLRKSALAERGLLFDPSLVASEDYCLVMELAVDSRISVLKEPLAKYRIHDGALTNHSISRWAEERERTLDLIIGKHPDIRVRYGAAFDVAYARASYYRAQYFVFIGDRRSARAELRKILSMDYRYVAAYILLFMPTFVWNIVQRVRTKRSVFKK